MWLGVNAATDHLSVGLWRDGRAIAQAASSARETHAEDIFASLEFLMQQAGCKPQELRGVGVTRGPGGFTGVRVGLSVAKTVGLVLDVPVYGIDTLEAVAWACEGVQWVSPMLDARRGLVFGALYRRTPGGWESVLGGRLAPLDEWLAEVSCAVPAEEAVVLTGEGLHRHREAITARHDSGRWHFASGLSDATVALATAQMAERLAHRGVVPAHDALAPLYLREPQAVINWEQQQARGNARV